MKYGLVKNGIVVNVIELADNAVIGDPDPLPDRPEMPAKPQFKKPKKPTTKEIKALEVWRIEVQEWRKTVLEDWKKESDQIREHNKRVYQPPEGMTVIEGGKIGDKV